MKRFGMAVATMAAFGSQLLNVAQESPRALAAAVGTAAYVGAVAVAHSAPITAVDTDDIETSITNQIVAVGLVAAAVLALTVGVKVYKYIKAAL